MAYTPNYEHVFELDTPLPISDLKPVEIAGRPSTLATQRPALYKESLENTNRFVATQMIANAKDGGLISVLEKGDVTELTKAWNSIGANFPKTRLSSASYDPSTHVLQLATSATSYHEFMGTNAAAIIKPDFRERMMVAGMEDFREANAYFANMLAACTLPFTKDLSAVVGLRGNRVSLYQGVHHVFGGAVDRGKDGAMILKPKEVGEEIGLTHGNGLGDALFLGFVKQKPSQHSEMIMGTPIHVDGDELLERWRAADDKFEHKGIEVIPFSGIPAFLDQYGEKMVPSGAAALDLLVRHQDALRARF